MPRVAVASENPDKCAAVVEACRISFGMTDGVEAFAAPAKTAQPNNDNETRQLACDRLGFVEKVCPNADYWVGIESGLEQVSERTMVSSWIAVRHAGEMVLCRSASFELPGSWAARLRTGGELGDLVQQQAHRLRTHGGAISVLTDGRIGRSELLVQPIVAALMVLSKLRQGSC